MEKLQTTSHNALKDNFLPLLVGNNSLSKRNKNLCLVVSGQTKENDVIDLPIEVERLLEKFPQLKVSLTSLSPLRDSQLQIDLVLSELMYNVSIKWIAW